MQRLRLVAGRLKNRRLHVAPGGVVRPTPERVREAVFDILGDQVERARVLDAFCGSGALGFEALSRGAREVVFVESRADVADVLRRNVDRLGVRSEVQILIADAIEALETGAVRGPFDLVLADPPYALALGSAFAEAVAAGTCLSPGGVLVLERSSRQPSVDGIAGLELRQSRRYGDVSVDFYARDGNSA